MLVNIKLQNPKLLNFRSLKRIHLTLALSSKERGNWENSFSLKGEGEDEGYHVVLFK